MRIAFLANIAVCEKHIAPIFSRLKTAKTCVRCGQVSTASLVHCLTNSVDWLCMICAFIMVKSPFFDDLYIAGRCEVLYLLKLPVKIG